MGKRRRKKQYNRYPPRRDERRGDDRGGRPKRSRSGRQGKIKPACPICGGLLYSVEGGFYCGNCGWDDVPETPPTGEEK